jgi:bacteriocin-like protein
MTAEIVKHENCNLHELTDNELDGITGGFFPVLVAGPVAAAGYIALGAMAAVGAVVVGAAVYSIVKHATA